MNLNPAVERRKVWHADDFAAIWQASQFTQLELLRSCLNCPETRTRYGSSSIGGRQLPDLG